MPTVCFSGFSEGRRGGQQQFATQTLRVHLLGLEMWQIGVLTEKPCTFLVQNVMRCAKGFVAKGIWGCTGFRLLRWEKGSETPSCGGEKGLRLPRSLGRSMRNEGVSDPFPHRKRESQTLFPTAKAETPYIPKSP